MKKILILIIATVSVFTLAGCNKTGTTTVGTGDTTGTIEIAAPSKYDDFAKCITAAGAKMYGTATCPHCQNQKELFGESFQYINFTDCLEDPNACSTAKIEKVPTWEYKDGTQEVGQKTLEDLAEKTKCELPK